MGLPDWNFSWREQSSAQSVAWRLDGVRDIASAIISHERLNNTKSSFFQTGNAVFRKNLFSDYWKSCSLGFLFWLFYFTSSQFCVILFRLVPRAGCGTRLYRFLIINYVNISMLIKLCHISVIHYYILSILFMNCIYQSLIMYTTKLNRHKNSILFNN